MTFLELGLALRDARMARGLSVDDIADKLKLTSSLVRKLEEGDIASLPHAVYTRGFIRGYAAIVGVNLEEYQSVIDEVYPLNVPDEYEEKITLVPSARRRSQNKYMMLLACIVFGGVLLGAYWKFSQPNDIVVPVINGPVVEQDDGQAVSSALDSSTKNENQGNVPAGDSAKETGQETALTIKEHTARELAKGQELNAEQGSSKASASTDDDAHNDGQTSVSLQGAGVTSHEELGTQADSDTQVIKAKNTSDEKTQAVGSEGTSPANTSRQHEIKVTAQEDCWMRVVPDGGKVSQMTLKKGATMTYYFDKSIEMRFGNGGGVSLSYNGKAMPAPGKRGKPVTVVYPLQD